MTKKILILSFLLLGASVQNIVAQKVTKKEEWVKKVMIAEQEGDYARAAAMLCRHYYTHFDEFSRQRLLSLVRHYGLQGFDFLEKKWLRIPARFFKLLAAVYCLLFCGAFWLLIRRKKIRYLFTCWGIIGGAAWFFYSLPPERVAVVKPEAALIYQAPSVAARLMGTLPRGTCLTVVGEQPLWWQVRTPQGQIAYVQKSLVYPVGPGMQMP